VTRANSYYTAPCDWTEEEYKHAEEADIVAFASPSAVKVWKDRMGTHQQVVAIGPTTEKAALRAGFTRVSSPNEGSQGIDHWAAEIKNVAVSIVNTK
jgi:uroporphyrinogen-III synthase